jgi:hypothetical protein
MRREHPSQQGYEPFSFQDTELVSPLPRRAGNTAGLSGLPAVGVSSNSCVMITVLGGDALSFRFAQAGLDRRQHREPADGLGVRKHLKSGRRSRAAAISRRVSWCPVLAELGLESASRQHPGERANSALLQLRIGCPPG